MNTDAYRLSVYFGESVTVGAALASEALMACFADHGLTAAALLRGIEGFGLNRRLHAERFPDVSTDLPLVAVAVDTRERIRAALVDVDRAVPGGLVTLEEARLLTGDDVAAGDFPAGPGPVGEPVGGAGGGDPGPGSTGKLTVYCGARERAGRAPAYRAVVAALREHGATGATVLPGVDGLLHGTRRRARLFSANASTPLAIVSVGPRDRLRDALPRLAALLADPLVTLERTTRIKHDGRRLAPLPAAPDGDGGRHAWQAIRVYARRNALVDGRPLYSELTRALRESGAAGATTILGDWGFSGDEPPYGDRLGRVASHRPTYTVYVDSAEKVGEVWPLIDDLTAEHGLVTSLLLPGYRERSGGAVYGALEEPSSGSGRSPADRDR
jgi:PII-like signaling protein